MSEMVQVIRKNKLGEKLDDVMDGLSERRRRFYGDNVDDDSYVIVLTSLPFIGSSFFEMKDEGDMYRTIYDIMGEVGGSSYKNLNKKYSLVERMYEPNMKTTTCLLLDQRDDYPRINYGTGKQFKVSRLGRLF